MPAVPPPDAAALARKPQAVRITLQGAARLHLNTEVRPLERKDAGLLAYLVLQGPTQRALLASLLWPQVDAAAARRNLRQRLFRLRAPDGSDLVTGQQILSLESGVGSDLAPADLAESDALTGDLLPGCEFGDCPEFADWLSAARERLREQQLEAWRAAAATHEANGELAAAIALAQRIVAADPLAEHGHRRLMRLHHLRGDRAAALEAYERCVHALDEEMGSAPSTETRALARQIDSQPDTPAGSARPVPVSVLRPPRLIGRQTEWLALGSAWASGATALVMGEAGMGKTRIVGDFAAAQRGVHTVTARPGDARAPYAVLSRLLQGLLPLLESPLNAGDAQELARLLPSLGSPPPSEPDAAAGQVRLLHAAQALLARVCAANAGHRVAGVVLDDLQFADAASVEAIQQLMGAELPLNWLLACRPVELPRETRLLCDELLHAHAAVEVRLLPLSEAQVGELIESLGIDGLDAPALASRLTRHTGGNPMFLLETMKALLVLPAAASGAERLPAVASVTDLIQRRIARLSEGAVRLARCAAVTGQDFCSELASQVLGVRALDMADAWNELEAAQVFRGGAFAHDLIYEAALASVPAPIATLLHGQIARYLESQGHAPARVAQHWLDAGEPARGAEALLLAAKDAGQLLRLREQAELLERAADVLLGLKERRRCFEVLLELQDVVASTGSAEQRDHVFDSLMAVADTPEERHAVMMERAIGLFNLWRWSQGLVAARAAVDDAVSRQAPALMTAEARTRLAGGLSTTGQLVEAEQQFRLARPAMVAHPDPRERAAFVAEFATFLDNIGRNCEARIEHQAALDAARLANEMSMVVDILANVGVSYMDSGLPRLAAQALEESIRTRRVHELHLSGGTALHTLGQALRATGEYAASIAHTEEQRALWMDERSPFVCICDYSLATTYLHLGQFARAQQLMQAAVVGEDIPLGIRVKFQVMRARVADAQGQPAAPHLARGDALLKPELVHGLYWRQLELEWSLALEPAEALARARQVLAVTEQGEHFGAQISVHTRCAAAALRAPDLASALAHARQALDLLTVYDPDDLYRAEVGWVAWKAFTAAGEPSAGDVLEQTAAWVLETERLHVPDAFKSSFRTRNRVNRELLAAAAAQARSPNS